jgi:hypothetical protein
LAHRAGAHHQVAAQTAEQLDYPATAGRAEGAAVILDPAPSPEDVLIERERWTRLGRLLDTISPREARVICLRYGIGCDTHMLDEVGELFGVTRERVRQIEAKGFRKLKHPARRLANPFRSRWRGPAQCNLHLPDWKRELIVEAEAYDARRDAYLEKKARKAARQEELNREAGEREARRQAQREREAREWRLIAAAAREQWDRDEPLRQWAHAESQRAAAALRAPYVPPSVPVYSPTYNAAFRRPIYVQVKHG